uniref:Stum, mechanosensory transduction mediator homolog n=1 Tax=Oncorhynchus tshawytscha TaxID=74940 RepID=A0AAZ3QGU7_ONCTS
MLSKPEDEDEDPFTSTSPQQDSSEMPVAASPSNSAAEDESLSTDPADRPSVLTDRIRTQLVCRGPSTFVSAFTVLCGARTDLPDRHMCCVFWLNIAAAFIQILTAIIMVGWIMSIFWGMDMVILASYRDQRVPQQV